MCLASNACESIGGLKLECGVAVGTSDFGADSTSSILVTPTIL